MDGKTNSQSQPLWVEGHHLPVPEPEKYEKVHECSFLYFNLQNNNEHCVRQRKVKPSGRDSKLLLKSEPAQETLKTSSTRRVLLWGHPIFWSGPFHRNIEIKQNFNSFCFLTFPQLVNLPPMGKETIWPLTTLHQTLKAFSSDTRRSLSLLSPLITFSDQRISKEHSARQVAASGFWPV